MYFFYHARVVPKARVGRWDIGVAACCPPNSAENLK
jgi:hypothetical protein